MDSRQDSPSPPRKRMRLSSPTFDDQIGDLNEEDINAFDLLNAQLSQAAPASSLVRQISVAGPSKERHSPKTSPSSGSTLAQEPAMDEGENPFCSTPRGATSIDALPRERIHASFMSAAAINGKARASFPINDTTEDESDLLEEAPPEFDYTAWFNSESTNTFASFKTAATALPDCDALPVFQRPSLDVSKPKGFILPSATALRKAEEKMKMWQEDERHSSPQPTPKEPTSSLTTQLSSPPRHAFTTAKKSSSPPRVPETPTPAPHFKSANAEPPPSSIRPSFQSLGGKRPLKPFKSPLIAAAQAHPTLRTTTANVSSPLRVHQSFAPASSQVPSTPGPVSPLRPSSAANQAMSQKPLGFTPRYSGAAMRPKFVTPFKGGIKPSDPGPSTLGFTKPTPTPLRQGVVANRVYPQSPRPSKLKEKRGGSVFDLTRPGGRQTLVSSGLQPQSHSVNELEDMGINVQELSQINPRTALFYAFSTRLRSPPDPSESEPPLALGHGAALEELHQKGCPLATKAWVENHWPLVLWKLAGMVALDPASENDPTTKRWCWPELIRQLMYRYERDLNGSSRPPLRLITTRDAPAESSMVLCVSDIKWSAGGLDDNDVPVPAHPELEVTDGWYRLRARIDAPLGRAIRKGKIKIGRKIAVAGAKLSAERKEGSEILEAYDSNVLVLSGNSSHIAPWHAKLGFQKGPFVATLNSLTADGGNVAVMMFEVIKAYPVAYIEFVEDESGRKRREGPRAAKDEAKLVTQWKAKRESEASKLWADYEKRRSRMADYAERLEQRAGSKFNPQHDDGPPDSIDDMYDEIEEDPAAVKRIISSISSQDAGWLARHIRDKAVQEREGVEREIDQELESVCPARDVRDFCVLLVKDARTHKHPSTRKAQVTVWDVLGLSVTEGSSGGSFEPGQRFLVTNLVPTQQSAWMDRSPDSEVYLSTRKNSKWTRLR
ncbi:hypothetical protein HYDPIDRAFT_109225 [Hydnomerulius pinastri MD-312]|nr:hypothetical protein HYDPIDRAFT_109225 [Hydnomerulius pinastri MD-312]